jgi:hypothetical protein
MTRAEFIAYWLSNEDGFSELDQMEEGIGEHEAQYASECALYGDAGPGQGLRLREMRATLAGVKRQLRRLGAIA